MPSIVALQNKITELETRIKLLEADQEFTNSLYPLAKELVAKHHQVSAIFLQKKLLIDNHRANILLDKLRINRVI